MSLTDFIRTAKYKSDTFLTDAFSLRFTCIDTETVKKLWKYKFNSKHELELYINNIYKFLRMFETIDSEFYNELFFYGKSGHSTKFDILRHFKSHYNLGK